MFIKLASYRASPQYQGGTGLPVAADPGEAVHLSVPGDQSRNLNIKYQTDIN